MAKKSSGQITAKNATQQIPGIKDSAKFVISKMYNSAEAKTIKQWKQQFIHDGIIDDDSNTSKKSTESQE